MVITLDIIQKLNENLSVLKRGMFSVSKKHEMQTVMRNTAEILKPYEDDYGVSKTIYVLLDDCASLEYFTAYKERQTKSDIAAYNGHIRSSISWLEQTIFSFNHKLIR